MFMDDLGFQDEQPALYQSMHNVAISAARDDGCASCGQRGTRSSQRWTWRQMKKRRGRRTSQLHVKEICPRGNNQVIIYFLIS